MVIMSENSIHPRGAIIKWRVVLKSPYCDELIIAADLRRDQAIKYIERSIVDNIYIESYDARIYQD